MLVRSQIYETQCAQGSSKKSRVCNSAEKIMVDDSASEKVVNIASGFETNQKHFAHDRFYLFSLNLIKSVKLVFLTISHAYKVKIISY